MSRWLSAFWSLFAVVLLAWPGKAADWGRQDFTPDLHYLSWVDQNGDATPTATGDRRLLLSDNPEFVNPDDEEHNLFFRGTLWWDGAINAGAGKTSQPHRVFLWHVNQSNEERMFAITVKNRSASVAIQITAAACKQNDVDPEYGILRLGKEIALAGITGLGAWAPDHTTIGPGQTEVIWQDTPVADTHLIGGLFQFTVQRSGPTGCIDYLVRTVNCGTGEDPTWPGFDEPLAAEGMGNYRGSWPYCAVSLSNENDPFLYPGHPEHDLGFADPLHTPNEMSLFSAANSWDGGAMDTANGGLYGVTEVATLYVHSPGCPNISGGNLSVWARGTGDWYAGACEGKGIPAIKDGAAGQEATVSVHSFPAGGTRYFPFTIMHAGGAGLPVAIEFRWRE